MQILEQLGHIQILAAEGQRLAALALRDNLAGLFSRAASLLRRYGRQDAF